MITSFAGPVDLFQFSPAQYVLSDDQNNPYPIKAEPPVHMVTPDAPMQSFELPAYSLTVIRGAGPNTMRTVTKQTRAD
jgi:hypothetical protein